MVFFFRKRMTAHECLLHSWLTGEHSKNSDHFSKIDSSNYIQFRDNLRNKYDNWDSFSLPIGRLSEYSALRKLLIDKYRIEETSFGKSEKYSEIYRRIFLFYFILLNIIYIYRIIPYCFRRSKTSRSEIRY